MKTRRLLRREGQALVLVALMLPVLIGMAGASVTVGTVYYSQAKLQSAVDAAALAGAKALSASRNPSAAQSQSALVTQNDANAIDVHVAVSPTNPNLVIANATVVAPGTFASLFGHSTFTVNAHAVAAISPGAPFGYTIFQGDTNASGPQLLLNGTDNVVNTTGADTANVHSNNNLNLTGHVDVQGSCSGDPSVTVDGNSACSSIIQNAPQLAMPQWTPTEVTPQNATTVGSPTNPIGMTVSGNTNGNYIVYGNLVIDGSPTVTGHYLVEDGNITVKGNATVTGSLVTFGGGILLDGNVTQSGGGALALAAFTRHDTTASNATNPSSSLTPGAIVINGNVSVNSTLYAPDSYVDLNGNVSVNGAVIGYTVDLNGNVTVTQNTAANNAVPVQQVTLVR